MKHWMFGFALLGMAAVPAMAQAEGLSYDYVEARYMLVNVDDAGMKADGDMFGVEASYEAVQNVHLLLRGFTGSVDVDGAPITVDMSGYNIGAGYHMPIEGVGVPLDVGATIAYVNTHANASGIASETDDGYAIDAEVRAMVTDVVEAKASVTFSDSGGSTDTEYGLLGVYNVTPQIGITAGANFSDTTTLYGAGVRFNF